MKNTERITEVWTFINNIKNWDEESFDWNKAYVASIFSKIAYLHIPEYELKNANRANLIPCIEYREIVKSNGISNISEILRSSNFGDYFIVERPYVIAVVVKVKNVLFISMRGTQQLHDWLINLNVLKSRPYPNKNVDIFLHKGFHRAAVSCINEISSEILKRYGEDNKIYITGHSLGGALAAILHGLWNERSYNFIAINDFKSIIRLRMNERFRTHSCYVFGMPRYGNFHAMEYFASPFHIYNQADIVPTVPPKILGFHDSLIEYCLNSEGKIDQSNIKGNSFAKFVFRLVTLKVIREHDIELYMSRVGSVINVN